jgi:uncharacterized membrane protein YfcA
MTAATALTPGSIAALWGFGALCAVAGIGGGGILIWILMFIGGLSLQEAMPLSRVVVFIGALVSFALNLGRHSPDCSKPLIDWLLVKMVVPMALLGTLIGAMTNEQTPGSGIFAVLVVMMGCTLLLLLQRAQKQHLEEVSAYSATEHAEEVEGLLDDTSFRKPTPLLAGWGSSIDFEAAAPPLPEACCSKLDVLLLVVLAIVVISGGVLQRHVRACFHDRQEINGAVDMEFKSISRDWQQPLPDGHSCHHPVLAAAFWGHADFWLARKGFASTALMVSLIVPVWACFGTAMFYVNHARRESWNRRIIACYLSVGLLAGMLTSLVGICGGLIFSPFFLLVDIDPAVAIATSSTCVVFTSSSMALQYFFIDRIPLQLAISFGSVNAFASLCGTSLVQHLGERRSMKKSYITLIVALGLAVSITVSAVKGSELIQTPQKTPT